MLQSAMLERLRHHHALEAGATQKIACQRVLSPDRESQNRATMHPYLPTLRNRKPRDQTEGEGGDNNGVKLKVDPTPGVGVQDHWTTRGFNAWDPQLEAPCKKETENRKTKKQSPRKEKE